jgi:uncharacterized protein DUF397
MVGSDTRPGVSGRWAGSAGGGAPRVTGVELRGPSNVIGREPKCVTMCPFTGCAMINHSARLIASEDDIVTTKGGCDMRSYDPHAIRDEFPADRWAVSAACGPDGGECVEVNLGRAGVVGVRHRPAGGPVLVFKASEWRAFLSAVRTTGTIVR